MRRGLKAVWAAGYSSSYRVSDYLGAPGLYGMSYGFASYGMPQTYTVFSAYPGASYGSNFPPYGILPGRFGVGLWRPGFVAPGYVYGASYYQPWNSLVLSHFCGWFPLRFAGQSHRLAPAGRGLRTRSWSEDPLRLVKFGTIMTLCVRMTDFLVLRPTRLAAKVMISHGISMLGSSPAIDPAAATC